MDSNDQLALFKKYLPNIHIQDVQSIDNGWDNDILVINQSIVFRFPKSDKLLSKVVDEARLLECLTMKKPILKIPNYELVYDGHALKGVKYNFLRGKSLNEYPTDILMGDQENAKGLGDFLSKLHSIDLSDLQQTNLATVHTLDYWEKLYAAVQSEVFPHLDEREQDKMHKVFKRFIHEYPSLTYKKAVIHGDLSASNIIYNQSKGRVDGIIDFTDAQIGDPAFDFAGFYWSYGPEFTKEVLAWYSGQESSNALFNRVQTFYGLQTVFHELLHAVKTGETFNWDAAVQRFLELEAMASA
ncbi:phosphotransferase family protein [Camelliibacillus cellulosilyticus]|uniref:Phosphotransferase family protein n=1 Tax=Camelliibacillus cellulosilyticus TaxID=2174486 RepID=A0ABV9GQF1_9BACL